MLNWVDENQHPHPFGLSSPSGRIEVSAEAGAPTSIRCATQSERSVWMLNGINENQHPRPFGLSSPSGRIEVSAEADAPGFPIGKLKNAN